MKMPGNLFLIGPMGAGKTTIGRQLANVLQKTFLDSDREIEKRTGASISLIFDVEGEAGFRRRERTVIDELTAQQDIVLATGGGAILDPDNQQWLRVRGCVIYLHCSIARQLERTAFDHNRPLLREKDPEEKLEELFQIREPLYRKTADWVVVTNGFKVKQVVDKIVAGLADGSCADNPA